MYADSPQVIKVLSTHTTHCDLDLLKVEKKIINIKRHIVEFIHFQ